MSPASTISLLVALGALAALLSALEATITSLRAHQLEILGTSPESARVRRAARLVRRKPQTVLLAVLLASALTNLSLVALAVYLVLEHAPSVGFRHLPAALVHDAADLLDFEDVVDEPVLRKQTPKQKRSQATYRNKRI